MIWVAVQRKHSCLNWIEFTCSNCVNWVASIKQIFFWYRSPGGGVCTFFILANLLFSSLTGFDEASNTLSWLSIIPFLNWSNDDDDDENTHETFDILISFFSEFLLFTKWSKATVCWVTILSQLNEFLISSNETWVGNSTFYDCLFWKFSFQSSLVTNRFLRCLSTTTQLTIWNENCLTFLLPLTRFIKTFSFLSLFKLARVCPSSSFPIVSGKMIKSNFRPENTIFNVAFLLPSLMDEAWPEESLITVYCHVGFWDYLCLIFFLFMGGTVRLLSLIYHHQ